MSRPVLIHWNLPKTKPDFSLQCAGQRSLGLFAYTAVPTIWPQIIIAWMDGVIESKTTAYELN